MASQISGYIGKLNPGNGTEYSLGSTAYGICSTAAGTVAKTVDMTGFTLITGATIFVKFTNANSATNPTLNVNSTGAKALLKYGSSSLSWQAGAVLCLTYDGTSWIGNSVTLQDLGLSNAMHFIGKATVAITDGGTENPTITGYDFTNDRKPGDVIIDKDNGREYVWTIAGAWEILGRDASTTFDSGAAQTNKWISRLQQDSAGNLTATIGELDTSGTWSGNAATADKVNKDLIIKINTGSTEGTSLYTFNGSTAKTLDIKAGTGISFGTLAAGILTIGHSNSITAKTSYGSTVTTASADGGTIKVTDVKYDAQGHITESTDRTITLSQIKNTAGSTNTSSKIFLIGATTQAANPQTYSDDKVFVEDGELSVRKLKITSTAGIKHIEFSRASYNYIWAPDSGSVAIGANDTVSLANSTMVATETTLYPGTDSTISLGIANNHWKDSFFDTIYVSSNTGYTASTSAQNGTTISGAGWIDMTSENTSTLPHIDFKIAKSKLDYQVRLDSNSPGRLRILRDTTNVTTSKAAPNQAANLTYNNRSIDPIFHVVGKTYVNGDMETSGYFLNNVSGTSGGYYLYGTANSASAQYGRLFINKIGTAGTYTPGEEGAAATTTNGTLGEVYLTLGNATPQTPTDADHLGANNARGRIQLYGTGANYTEIISQPSGNRIFYLPQFAGTMYAVHAGSNAAVGTATKPVYIAANGRATVGTYELKATVNDGTATYMAYYSGANAISPTSIARVTALGISIYPTTAASYGHGMRIHSISNWSGILLCGNDQTTDAGTSANSWFVGNNNGNFYITRNGSTSSSSAMLACVNNVWSWNGTATGNISGNAGTATTLQTARTINGTSFNGSANITTENWGTARTLTIGATGKSVNGSANVSWSIGEIVGSTAIGGTAKPIYWTGSAFSAISATVGSATKPVYLNAGTITACSYELNSTVNAGTATRIAYYSGANAISSGSIVTDGAYLRNVGGYNNTSYALSTASFICNSWVRTVGSTGWYSETYGGGWYMSDTSWIRTYGSKNVYQNTGIIRTDGQFQVGGNGSNFYANSSGNGFFSNILGVGAINTSFRLTVQAPANTAANLYLKSSTSGQWSYIRIHNNAQYWDIGSNSSATGSIPAGALKFGYNGANDGVWITTAKVLFGAAWNDYAEFRKTEEKIEPGRCVKENGDDTLSLTTKRLERGCEIVSDTYGFAIGQTEECQTPTAASGRVLAYLYEGQEIAKTHIGYPVCSGPKGTVSIMTEEEEEKYPSRIIGTISAVPDYEIWHGAQDVKVNGRVWIRIR